MAYGFAVSNCAKLGGQKGEAVRYAFDPSTFDSSTSLILADESWRQYVFPLVTFGVLVDILLGSPLANAALKPLKRGGEGIDNEVTGDLQGAEGYDVTRSKERIDSEQLAKDAIARAENALELRKFLEERKSDWDKMEELKKSLDEDMQDFDSDYQNRGASLAEELEKRRNKN
eukprot:scaffold1525_cov142-Cylindrotheca_fusiformis.AAC.19